MTGLARDRGLFVPDTIPQISKEELERWRSLSFRDLAVKVVSKFVQGDQVPEEKLENIVKRSCAVFRHEDVTPVVSVGGHKILVSSFRVTMTKYLSSKSLSDGHRLTICICFRNFFTDRLLHLKMLHCNCWETFLNTSWKLDLMMVA
jgi:hypothetical protein